MKIQVAQIPPEGLVLDQEECISDYDLDTDAIKFSAPLFIRAEVFRITNAVTVNTLLSFKGIATCSRCLVEFEATFNRKLQLHYEVHSPDEVIDLLPDIREEIILDFPIKFLCSSNCKGLCPRCGKDLNKENCSCFNLEERS